MNTESKKVVDVTPGSYILRHARFRESDLKPSLRFVGMTGFGVHFLFVFFYTLLYPNHTYVPLCKSVAVRNIELRSKDLACCK